MSQSPRAMLFFDTLVCPYVACLIHKGVLVCTQEPVTPWSVAVSLSPAVNPALNSVVSYLLTSTLEPRSKARGIIHRWVRGWKRLCFKGVQVLPHITKTPRQLQFFWQTSQGKVTDLRTAWSQSQAVLWHNDARKLGSVATEGIPRYCWAPVEPSTWTGHKVRREVGGVAQQDLGCKMPQIHRTGLHKPSLRTWEEEQEEERKCRRE